MANNHHKIVLPLGGCCLCRPCAAKQLLWEIGELKFDGCHALKTNAMFIFDVTLRNLLHLTTKKILKEWYLPFPQVPSCHLNLHLQLWKCEKTDFWGFLFSVLYSTLLHLPPLSLHCVGGCWDRTRNCCKVCIDSQSC